MGIYQVMEIQSKPEYPCIFQLFSEKSIYTDCETFGLSIIDNGRLASIYFENFEIEELKLLQNHIQKEIDNKEENKNV